MSSKLMPFRAMILPSGDFLMELLEPKGWRELWKRAQAEKDTKKLLEIIDEMNRLLTEWEKKGRSGEGSTGSDSTRSSFRR